jgi:hypothetical protein
MEKGIGSLIGESGRTISNMDRMMADQAARQGMSPAEQRMMMIQKTAADMGRTFPIEMLNFSVWVKSVLKKR